MNGAGLYGVVTTIQPPSRSMRGLARVMKRAGGKVLVIGDSKGPQGYPLDGAELLTLERQLTLPLALPRLLPVNHYVRKNVGYLVAIARGAQSIYETDDDNEPTRTWTVRNCSTRAVVIRRPGWCNVYRHFTDALIWPRGFPLNEIHTKSIRKTSGRQVSVNSPIQQGLADLNPDVDAVWRLVFEAPVRFDAAPSVALGQGVWCPFNSQSTWWWPEAYPLMYLPSFCTFRMTDVWRSFVAQRCLWEMGRMVSFHAAEVVQRRNRHDLMRDLADEIPGYRHNAGLVKTLAAQRLEPGSASASVNLIRCYEALVRRGICPAKELKLVRSWVKDLSGILHGTRATF